MSRKRAREGAAAAVLLALGLLAGCGSDDSGGDADAGGRNADAASTSSPSSRSSSATSESETEDEEESPEPESTSPCYDGECEITVSEGTEIPVDGSEFGVDRLVITSIEEVDVGMFTSPAVDFDGYDGSEVVGRFSLSTGSSGTFNDALTIVPAEVNVDAGTARLEIMPEPSA